MGKADILDFFAGLALVVGAVTAILFIIQGISSPFNSTASYLIALAVFFGSLFQYAVLGGVAEIIKRLISIDETAKAQTRPPTSGVRPAPPSPLAPDIGRSSRQ